MRLYLTSCENQQHDTLVKWSGTQADARTDRKTFKEAGHDFIGTEEIDVPTDKAGLLEFLNKYNVIAEKEEE